ncbi:MAG: transketolase C-terminal domain-containing protein, partial [Candidatus Subteraquimicrobiales bacterium]|nr:transketolase C-terminal domain-containing protein [Candidatus Subteraquimicrobiales bacterium]
TLKPFDESSILALCRKTRFVVTVEEHGPGGLGSAVAEVIARSGISISFIPMTLKPENCTIAGDQKSLRIASGIAAEGIVDTVMGVLAPARKTGKQRGSEL